MTKSETGLCGFDINMDALGEEIANERVVREVSPEADGLLRIATIGIR